MLACVTSGLSMVKLCVKFMTNPVCPSFVKDGLSYRQGSSVVYKFKCQYKADSVGQTKQ